MTVCLPQLHWAPLVFCGVLLFPLRAAMADVIDFEQQVLPILSKACFSCHGNGEHQAGLSLDQWKTSADRLEARDVWWKVLKNVRAGVMPPPGEPKLSAEEAARLEDWIKFAVFQIDPKHPDPGRLTIRRLNRTEYQNTLSELMGINFNAEVVFPAEDTGSGFDTVGDTLTLSPLLLEKYLQTAEKVVAEAVPRYHRLTPRLTISARELRDRDKREHAQRVDGKKPANFEHDCHVAQPGEYHFQCELHSGGSFDFDPARYRVKLSWNGELLLDQEFGWEERKRYPLQFPLNLPAGVHRLRLTVEPQKTDQKSNTDKAPNNSEPTSLGFSMHNIALEGPLGNDAWQNPPNYSRFFTRREPPVDRAERRMYAAEVLTRFAERAFRRPPDKATVTRLVDLSEQVWAIPDRTFESGIAQAMVALLASPRFLFRVDIPQIDSQKETYPLVDEHSLASRLSYFLWSSMPDQELFERARNSQLRNQLTPQLTRMLKDRRSQEFISHFVGQWLQVRDVRHVSIEPLIVLELDQEYQSIRSELLALRGKRNRESLEGDDHVKKLVARSTELRARREILNDEMRQAMQRETEMCFEYLIRENRSLLELLDANYTFLNERLASLYEIPNVHGSEMRKVSLPESSPRGGILTQGTMLVVTSNPTRTSPVKRGLFILDNILGTPAPPAPPEVPELEASNEKFAGRKPQLREVLALHRESALCSACHSRMDPLGLALENFNALGIWRETENQQPIDPSGELLSGAKFGNIRELKQILVTQHQKEFYRCVTEKMLTYALGRGLEDYDEQTVDQIVARLLEDGGRAQTLIQGVIESAPFQRMRQPMQNLFSRN